MRIKKIVKPLLFLAVLVMLLNIVGGILKRPVNGRWESSGLDRVYKNKNYYDVIFCGSSFSITNVSNVELYREYGIASVTLGEPAQVLFLTYYSLEEALKYQSPKVVCLDTSSLFYSDATLSRCMKDEYSYIHYTLDNMKNNKTKYEAFKQAREINPDLDFLNYFSVLYYSHANWTNLSKDNFEKYKSPVTVNGNTLLIDIYEDYADGGPTPLEEQEYTDEAAELIEINMKYLEKMIALCEEKGIQFVLLRSGGSLPWTWKRYNALENISEKYNVPLVDSGKYEEEMGFDWTTDLGDEKHFNISGTKKWTDCFGKYLTENYEFEDRRLDQRYDGYKEDEPKWQDAVDAMQLKLDLYNSVDFKSYLDVLNEIDREDNTIFISVKEDATNSLSSDSIEKLRQLGFALEEITEKSEYSFAGVVDAAGVRESLKNKKVTLKGILDNEVSYQVCSGGGSSKKSASIKIGSKEYIAGGRGINIVVYNKTLESVLSSVYFDTYAEENPAVSRK